MRQQLCLIGLFVSMMLNGQVSHKNNVLTIENSLLKKEILASKGKPSAVKIKSLFSKINQKELLSDVSAQPFFEFIINKELVTSDDESWVYQNHTIRNLANGGTEVKIQYRGGIAPVKGLVVNVYQQIFPNSTLIREKIELSALANQSFSLNKKEGRIYFKFPQYSIQKSGQATATEIRMATFGKELIDIDKNKTYDDRKFDGGKFHNLAQSHMFHPDVLTHPLTFTTAPYERSVITKGPINIIEHDGFGWISAYEHASQDSYVGFPHLTETTKSNAGTSIDAQQGVEGDMNMGTDEKDFWFLGFNQQSFPDKINISIDILRGGYLEGELITANKKYESVWTASAFYFSKSDQASVDIIREYLLNQITEKSASRKPEFYYNTWGMQRELSALGVDLRGNMTQKRILEEIDRAAKLNVDLFVLDDGWEAAQGDWTPNKERLPQGLAPIKKVLDEKGIKMGLWFSPMGIDSTLERYKRNRSWIIVDNSGNPIKAQWGHPAFDFVSDFKDTLVADSKALIDQGALFFKWDAINTFKSFQAGLHHGDSTVSKDELIARYEYLLPIYVVDAMKQITDYNPEVVIEIDLTETDRCMPGLIVLQQGKYFWMNNGASGYGDYSSHRAKSMRNIPFKFNNIIPLELFTYANYPHNAWMYFKQRYLVNSSLIAGHGFWGNLERLTDEQLDRAGDLVAKSKRVLPYLVDQPTIITGFVSSSPEIYTQINKAKGVGQVIAFSSEALKYNHKVELNAKQVLAVLNHAYSFDKDTLVLDFEFTIPDDTREAFVYSNNGMDVSITQSTCWLRNVELKDNQLRFTPGATGSQTILWNKKYGKPIIDGDSNILFSVSEIDATYFIIEIKGTTPGMEVLIK